jgi:hypothetical protein
MAQNGWQVSGEYFEACNCDFICPCPTSGLTARPTHGHCDAGLIFHVDRGAFGGTRLDGLNFAVLLHTPGPMMDGNWTVGLVLDERASAEQQQALTGIASGQAGGPMAALGPLLGTFAGAEVKPISFEKDGLRRHASIPGMLEIAIEGVPGANKAEPTYFDNVFHPVTDRLALAKATTSRLSAFGINWTQDAPGNNGHFAPFSWSG